MLDLATAGALAFLPLSIQTAFFAIIRAKQAPDACIGPPMPLERWLAESLGDPARAAALLNAARAAADRGFARAAFGGIHAIPWGAVDYPPLLTRIADPPPLLWVRGSAALLSLPTVAIVGSRAASSYGLEVAHHLASELAATGVVVVSGLARGVDSASHRGALTRGSTAAILGSGADVIYPAEHATLAHEIVRQGAVMSELPPGMPPRPHHFPRRNRLISGLSLAVVVVEASTRSGSLQTARLALEQGREVMAVPGSILGERNRGSHALLSDGAKLVERASDILDELRLPWNVQEDTTASRDRLAEPLASMPGGEAQDFQELMRMTQLPAGELLRQLLRAELAGHVVRTSGGRFLRVGRQVVR
jgi:DNA processing protein